MASLMKKTLFLAICFVCFIHFGATYTLVPGLSLPTNGVVPPRLELRVFTQNSTRLNILYLALERMQTTSTNQPLSFYQIGGIHGTNFAWDNDTNGGGSINYGYCRHADRLFPTWHRPYLSLYEKTLYDLATQIVAEFPMGTQKNRHLGVLSTWRLPYWDWASNPSIPSVLGSTQNVSVTKMVNGRLTRVTIPNPLFSYRFQILNDVNTVVTPGSIQTTQTVRNPIVQNGTYVTQASFTNNQMIQWGPSLKASVRLALSINTSYNAFSNMQDDGNSIEGVHGFVHSIVGGNGGHMGRIEFAGFDPLFYFHHANIDRLIALWQAINPNSYLSSNTANSPNENTELYPFRINATQYWTSKLARNVTAFGYTYPELIGATPQSIIAAINSLYGQLPSTGRRRKRTVTADNVEEDQNKLRISRNAVFTTYNEYVILITVSNGAANGPFRVYCFFGKPRTQEANYHKDPNLVGFLGIFAAKDLPVKHRKLLKGNIPLTTTIYELHKSGVLPDLTPYTISGYLKDNLKWRIVGDDCESYDMTGFEIDVVTAEVCVPCNNEELPTWTPFSSLFRITDI